MKALKRSKKQERFKLQTPNDKELENTNTTVTQQNMTPRLKSSTKINKIETKMKQTNKTTTKHINITRLEAKTKLGLKIQNYNHN